MVGRDDEILTLLAKIMAEQQDARSENFKSISDLDKKLDLHIQKTEFELQKITNQDEIQNQLLDQHIAGVNTLKQIHLAHVEHNNLQFEKVDREIEALKEPAKWIRNTTKLVLWLGGLGTSILGIYKLLTFLKGL